jgi:hypothetical protein
MKEEIKKLIKNVMERDYSKASKELSSIIDKKIQQKILNNNINIF